MPRFTAWLAAAALLAVSAPLAHAAPPRTIVVLIGGLNTTTYTTAENFRPLVGALLPFHVAVREFTYGGSALTYTSERSCQPLDQSTAELAAFVRGLRDRREADHVILVGHSNGGVLAFGLPGVAPDLVAGGDPFIRRIVTVDSPLGGLDIDQRWALRLHLGEDCPAGDDLNWRHDSAEWRAYLVDLAKWELQSGVDLVVVVNPQDWYVWTSEQEIYGVWVNHELEASTGGSNHEAVLEAPEAVAQLAQWVGAR